jgi:DNA-binding transcriptional LysR family regulator
MADRRLQVFQAVAKQGSFTKAADALFMSQPSVTFQIKQLEETYSTRLLERRHGHVELTEAGRIVYEYAEKILALNAEMETRLGEMSGEIRGELHLGASTTLAENFLSDLLLKFNSLYPQVKVCLCVANSGSIAEQVDRHLLDLALIDQGSELPGLSSHVCGRDELLMICAPDYPLAKMRHVSAKVLAEYEYLAREPGSAARTASDEYFQQQKIDPATLKIQMEVGSQETLKCLAASGLGFAITSRAAVDREIQLKLLKAIPFKPALQRNLYLIHPKERFLSRLVSTFIDFAQRHMRENHL